MDVCCHYMVNWMIFHVSSISIYNLCFLTEKLPTIGNKNNNNPRPPKKRHIYSSRQTNTPGSDFVTGHDISGLGSHKKPFNDCALKVGTLKPLHTFHLLDTTISTTRHQVFHAKDGVGWGLGCVMRKGREFLACAERVVRMPFFLW